MSNELTAYDIGLLIILFLAVSALLYSLFRSPAAMKDFYEEVRRTQEFEKRRMAVVIEMKEALAETTLRLLEIELKLAERDLGISKLIAQLSARGIKPVWVPNGNLAQSTQDSVLVELRQKLTDNFDANEIIVLAFDLGVPRDELAGDTLSTKVTSLITYVGRRGELNSLIRLAAEMRPNETWPHINQSDE